jgi:uncharacterized protein YutE (UPF0331/DUF86 family)
MEKVLRHSAKALAGVFRHAELKMGELSNEKIIALTSEVEKALIVLKEYAKLPPSDFKGNAERLGNMKYQFIVMLEGCIDICQHVSSRLFAQTPESYASCFEILHEMHVIEKELAAQMAELARFRNVLVHLYWKVDDSRVLQNLHKLQPVEAYLRSIATLLR